MAEDIFSQSLMGVSARNQHYGGLNFAMLNESGLMRITILVSVHKNTKKQRFMHCFY